MGDGLTDDCGGTANDRVEKKMTPRKSTELRPSLAGVVEVAELFYLRIGTLRLTRRWVDREVSPSLTAAAMIGIAAGGFLVGVSASWGLQKMTMAAVWS